VILVEFTPEIMGQLDPAIRRAVLRELRRCGVEVHLGCTIAVE
jgi:NADPH-dependent 2,4-dienoyl-CoA reductase/sulfur reductase-like enzyme